MDDSPETRQASKVRFTLPSSGFLEVLLAVTALLSVISAPVRFLGIDTLPGKLIYVSWVLALGLAIHFARKREKRETRVEQKAGQDRIIEEVVSRLSRRASEAVPLQTGPTGALLRREIERSGDAVVQAYTHRGVAGPASPPGATGILGPAGPVLDEYQSIIANPPLTQEQVDARRKFMAELLNQMVRAGPRMYVKKEGLSGFTFQDRTPSKPESDPPPSDVGTP